MEHSHLSVIPAKAGIHWLQVLGDPCLRRDDGQEAIFDTLLWGEGQGEEPMDSRLRGNDG